MRPTRIPHLLIAAEVLLLAAAGHAATPDDAVPVVETLLHPTLANDGLSIDKRGRVYASNNGAGGITNGDTIYEVFPDGHLEAYVSGLPAWPVASDFGPDGDLFVSCFAAGVVCRVSPSGTYDILASGIPGPAGLAVDEQGTVFVSSWNSHSVRRIDPDGGKSVLAQGAPIKGPSGLARDPGSGDVYVANWGDGRITRVTSSGAKQLFIKLQTPTGTGIASLEISERTLYASLWGDHRIMAVNLDTAVAHGLVGTGVEGVQDGLAGRARLEHPIGLAVSQDGTKLFFTQDALADTTAGGAGALRVVHLKSHDQAAAESSFSMGAVAQETGDAPERAWWYRALAGCVHEFEGDWAAAADDWAAATAAEPGYVRGWHALGIARMKAKAGDAQEPLQRATEFDQTRAAAWLGLARVYAGRRDDEQAQSAAQGAVDAELSIAAKELKAHPELRRVRKEAWFKAFEAHVTADPLLRAKRLADAADHERLVALLRSLAFRWRSEELSSVGLVHRLLGDVVNLAERGAAGSDDWAAAVARVRRVGAAADEVYDGGTYRAWIEAIVALDDDQRSVYRKNWKTIDGHGRMFRGHRFKELMRVFVPIEASTRSMGDTYGSMIAQGALVHTRECLVEYAVRGYDLTEEWRRAWTGMDEYRALATALGEVEEISSAYEDIFFLTSNYPKGKADQLRDEFQALNGIPQALIELTLVERALPVEERKISWTRKSLRDWKLYP